MFSELLARIAEALERAELGYMVIGGQAVLVHGEPRLTRDIDVTLGVALERLPDVLDAARGLGLEVLVDPEPFVRETMVLPCREPTSGIRVDFILSFTPFEQAAIARALVVEVGGGRVKFATAEDLVILKTIAGRARDLEDVRGVLLKNPRLDRAWIRRWLDEYERVLEAPLGARFAEIERSARV